MRASLSLIREPRDDIEVVDINNGRRLSFLPEHELMLAILEDAIGCYVNYVNYKSISRRTLFEDAERWFFRENEDWIFSFVNICRTVGLDPDYLRRGLLKVKTRILGAPPIIYRLPENHIAADGHACSECAARKPAAPAHRKSPALKSRAGAFV